jgi:hypothetical protein
MGGGRQDGDPDQRHDMRTARDDRAQSQEDAGRGSASVNLATGATVELIPLVNYGDLKQKIVDRAMG